MDLTAAVAPEPYREGGELLVVQIRPETIAAGDRPPLHLCLLIDRSSSMAGRPLSLAARAIQLLAARLQAGDHLAVVLFDATADVVLPMTRLEARDLEGLDEWVGPLRAGYGTDLEGALVTAARTFEGQYVRGAQRRILLLSDGHPRDGARQLGQFRNLATRLMDQGTSISSVALGEEANQVILESMAGPGGGNLYAVQDSGGLAGALAAELDAARSAVAMSAELYIEVGPGIKSLRLMKQYSNAPYSEGLLVHLGPIAAGVPRVVLGQVEGSVDDRLGSVKLIWQGMEGKEAAIAPIQRSEDMDATMTRVLRREMGLMHMLAAEEHFWRWYERDKGRAGAYLEKAREWLAVLSRENLLPADLLQLHSSRFEDGEEALGDGLRGEFSGHYVAAKVMRALPPAEADNEG